MTYIYFFIAEVAFRWFDSCLYRELPEPILTNDLLTRFEEAGAVMETDCREKALQTLIAQLPYQNKVLLGWLILHFDTVTLHVGSSYNTIWQFNLFSNFNFKIKIFTGKTKQA